MKWRLLAVIGKAKFEYGGILVLTALFGIFRLSGFCCREQNQSVNQKLKTRTKFLMKKMLEDIKPAITENYKFERRGESKFLAKLELLDYQGSDDRKKNVFFPVVQFTTSKNLLTENLMEEMMKTVDMREMRDWMRTKNQIEKFFFRIFGLSVFWCKELGQILTNWFFFCK